MSDFWDWVKVLVSPVVTFIAFCFTYSMNKKQINEESRVQILPFLNVLKYEELTEVGRNLGRIQFEPQIIPIDSELNKSTDIPLKLQIQNIGKATAVNIKLQYNQSSTEALTNISCGEIVYLFFYAKIRDATPFELSLIFSDLAGHSYKQTFKIFPHMYSSTDIAEADISLIGPPQ